MLVYFLLRSLLSSLRCPILTLTHVWLSFISKNQVITVALRTDTRYEGVLTSVSPSASDDASTFTSFLSQCRPVHLSDHCLRVYSHRFSACLETGLMLKNAKDLSNPSAPPKDIIKIPASNVLSFSAGSSGSGTMSKVHDCK